MTQTIDPAKIQNAKNHIKRLPHVNESCIGCGMCVAISGDVFEMNDECVSVVRPLDNYEGKDVDDAISACPVNAISWKLPPDASAQK